MQYNAIMDPKRDEVAEKRAKYGEQDEWGNDVATLRANLRLTPTQRILKAQRAAESLQELRRALRRID